MWQILKTLSKIVLIKVKLIKSTGIIFSSKAIFMEGITQAVLLKYLLKYFSNLTHHLEDTGIGVSGCTVPHGSKESDLGSSDQKASPSAGKNTGVVLVPCSRMEVHPYSYFWWYGYF